MTGIPKIPKVVKFNLSTKPPKKVGESQLHEQCPRLTVYLENIDNKQDASGQLGFHIDCRTITTSRDIPMTGKEARSMNPRDAGASLTCDWNRGLDDSTGDRGFLYSFYVMDDKECQMRNVILGNDFGKRVGLIYDLANQRVYYKDTFLIMSALDGQADHMFRMSKTNRLGYLTLPR